MNVINFFSVAAVPFVCLVVFIGCWFWSKKSAEKDRPTSNSLAVLTGLLTALAILVPLGVGLLPEKIVRWHVWGFLGSLIAGSLCVFAVIFSMVKVQSKEKFDPKDFSYVPASTNATWFALFFMAVGCLTMRFASNDRANTTENLRAGGALRFLVAHELPRLDSTRQAVLVEWGSPALEADRLLAYKEGDAIVVFCFDSKGTVESISETREAKIDAVRKICGAN